MEYQFEKLKIWQIGLDLAETAYSMTKYFPKEEQFGLTSQIRRAAVSIPSNIAEGKGRYYTKDFIRFLYIARGSVCELITLTKIAERLNYFSKKDSEQILLMCSDISGGTNGLINALK